MSTKVSRTVLKASREGNLPAEPACVGFTVSNWGQTVGQDRR